LKTPVKSSLSNTTALVLVRVYLVMSSPFYSAPIKTWAASQIYSPKNY
ncbi:diguanylate cyclase domain protein, partial [Vibrio parahaemolyticus V-223/04]